jgi:hypothetical protein
MRIKIDFGNPILVSYHSFAKETLLVDLNTTKVLREGTP